MAKTTKYSGTQTEKNLEAAFAGESQARNKYTYFASVAKKQGFEQIADLFLKTADNEKEHAKMWFKELNGIGDTAENLLAAAGGTKTTSGQICTKISLNCRGRRLYRACTQVPPCCRNRKAPRRKIPCITPQC